MRSLSIVISSSNDKKTGLANHRQAAAHAQDLARDVVRTQTGEKEYSIGDFLGFGKAPERDGPLESLQMFLRHCLQERRFGGTRADAVDVDVVARHFAGQRLCKGNDAALGAGIDSLPQTADPAGVAADVDNLAGVALHHPGQEGLDQVHRAAEVEVDNLVPELGCGFPERRDATPSSAVDDYIGHAHLASERFGTGGDGSVIGDVEVNVLPLVAFISNGCSGRFALV